MSSAGLSLLIALLHISGSQAYLAWLRLKLTQCSQFSALYELTPHVSVVAFSDREPSHVGQLQCKSAAFRTACFWSSSKLCCICWLLYGFLPTANSKPSVLHSRKQNLVVLGSFPQVSVVSIGLAPITDFPGEKRVCSNAMW